MIRILIGGDICPMGQVQNAFIKDNANEIFHDLLEEISQADLSIVNLECPLVSKETPIDKAGPVLNAHIKCVEGFKASKWNVLNLANNHSYDHGASGLRETIEIIKGAGLNVVGAGMNIKEAQAPFITQIKGRRIVIYSMAEHEFSIAEEDTPGANPLDLINFVNSIQMYKQNGLFIVLIHGGNEYYPYPSPEMVRRCHFMVDMGADSVICCHTHCPLPWETYAERPIIYGLGNLIFEATRKEPDTWYEGYLASLTVDDGHVGFQAIPYYQSRERIGAYKMDENEQKHFFDEIIRRNAQVKDSAFIDDRWANYCRQKKGLYLNGLFAYNRLMRKFSKLLLSKFHSKEAILQALLMVQCEAHREVLNTIFKIKRRG